MNADSIDKLQCLRQPIASPTPPVLEIPRQRMRNPQKMHRRSQNDKHVKYLMRTPPDIETSGVELFRKPHAIDEGTHEDQSALDIVVGKAGLSVELLEWE